MAHVPANRLALDGGLLAWPVLLTASRGLRVRMNRFRCRTALRRPSCACV